MTTFLTRTQVCSLLGVSAKTLYLWEQNGLVPRPKRDRRNWRVYGERDVAAIRKVLGRGSADPDGGGDHAGGAGGAGRVEGLSARNQLVGTVVAVHRGGLLAEVVVRLGDGQEMTSVITAASAARLGLQRGVGVTAVIKATEVMLFR